MEYQNKLSKLRHLMLKVQGQSLQQVLLRDAAKRADEVAKNVHTPEEIFHALTEKIYAKTTDLSWDESYNIVSDVGSLQEFKDECIESALEPFEWDETLDALLEGLEGGERKIVEVVLKNQHSHIQMAKAMRGSCSAGDIVSFTKLLLPIARNIFHNFEALKLVGVQPMTGPVGMAYLLRFQQENDDGEQEEVNHDEAKTKKITLNVIGKAIEASTRRLKAGWTLEATQDLNGMYGLDIENEMSQAIATEIQEEITAEILNNLRKVAGKPIEIELDGLEPTVAKYLAIHINKAANDIARKTRRGAGNWIVVSPKMVGMFQEYLPDAFAPKSDGKFGLFGSLMEVGTLNGTIKVFSSWSTKSDEVLVGYKGGNGETDTGYIYAPYVPVISSGVVINAKTFQPTVSLMTRYGQTLNGDFQYDEEGNKLDIEPKARGYYNLIKIKGELFTEKDSSSEDS